MLAIADPRAASVELTPAEAKLLLRILRRHRSSLPLYLRSSEEEIGLVDEVIRKISPSSR